MFLADGGAGGQRITKGWAKGIPLQDQTTLVAAEAETTRMG